MKEEGVKFLSWVSCLVIFLTGLYGGAYITATTEAFWKYAVDVGGTAAAVVSALIASYVGWLNYQEAVEQRLVKQGKLRFLVVRVAACLEEFLSDSCSLFYSWSASLEGGNVPDRSSVSLNKRLPDDVDWSLIDVSLLDEILNLDNHIQWGEPLVISLDEVKEEWGEEWVYEWEEEVLGHLFHLLQLCRHTWQLVERLRGVIGEESPTTEYIESMLIGMQKHHESQFKRWIKGDAEVA